MVELSLIVGFSAKILSNVFLAIALAMCAFNAHVRRYFLRHSDAHLHVNLFAALLAMGTSRCVMDVVFYVELKQPGTIHDQVCFHE